MTKVTQSFASELTKLAAQAAEDLAKLATCPVQFDLSNQQIKPLQEILVGFAPGAVCCRSPFVRNAHGVGGVLFHQDTAEAITQAITQVPRPADQPFQFHGSVDEAMTEAWNVLLGTWNRASIPDFRMSPSVEERSVEYYPSSIAFPPRAGIFPEALTVSITVGETTRPCAIFLPLRAVQGSEISDFVAPTHFERVTHATDAPHTPAAPAPTRKDRLRGMKPLAPVVFLDYSGMVLPWLRLKAKDERLKYVLAEGLKYKPGEKGEPVAAVIAAADLSLLEQLEDCAVVEIHKRQD